MAPFIGKSNGKIRVHFAKCEYPNTYVECEFKATETSDTHNESDDESPSKM